MRTAWNKGVKVEKACAQCHVIFSVHPYRQNTAKYCSRVCLGRATYQEKGFTTQGRKMPKSMRVATSRRMRGNLFAKGKTAWNRGIEFLARERHWNWQGGITSANTLIRTSRAYKAWRLSVFRRDWFTCQMCGYRGRQLEANHIKRFKDYPDLRFDVSNGITLCSGCHLQTRNREEQFEAYFNGIVRLGTGAKGLFVLMTFRLP